MNSRSRWLRVVVFAVLAGPAGLIGCATHHNYSPYYREYPDWDDHDRTYYLFWENETHREHRDYMRRSRDEQRTYWEWRRHHRDRDRDDDRDHDRDRD